MSLNILYLFSIQRYSVIPLSPNSGLIGWVPHCDTLHTLFKEYREKKKIMLNIEHRLMLQVKTLLATTHTYIIHKYLWCILNLEHLAMLYCILDVSGL